MSRYAMKLEVLEPRWLAVVRRRAHPDEISTVVPEACGEVWKFIRSTQLKHSGLNIAVYLNSSIDLECGVIVPEEFASSGQVFCKQTPLGVAVKTEHYGEYDQLNHAHRAVLDWSLENNRSLSGINWEIYDHWTDDPTQLHTTVYYQLKPTDLS